MRRTYYKPDNYLDADSLIQIDDGRILSFYFRDFRPLKIYDQKDFNEILSINLEEILKKNKKENNSFYDDEDETFELDVIQLKNKLILVGYYKYLIKIKLNENNFESKVVFEDKEIILSINELPDGRIILFTNISILVLDNFILKDKYNIKINWKIVPLSSTENYYGDFNQYFSSIILPDERILLRSFSTELSYHCGYGTHPPDEFIHSKIIFLNTKNFEEIKTKNQIIAYSIYEKSNNLLIFRVEGNDIIQNCEIKSKFEFREVIGWNFYSIIKYNNKILFVLKDKRIILLCHGAVLLLDLKLE